MAVTGIYLPEVCKRVYYSFHLLKVIIITRKCEPYFRIILHEFHSYFFMIYNIMYLRFLERSEFTVNYASIQKTPNTVQIILQCILYKHLKLLKYEMQRLSLLPLTQFIYPITKLFIRNLRINHTNHKQTMSMSSF